MNRKKKRSTAEHSVRRERARALTAQGVDLHGRGDLVGAERAYREALRLDPANPLLLHYLGLIAAQKGSFKEAERLIAKAITREPANVEALRNLGKVRLTSGNPQAAEEVLRKALQFAPDDPPTLTVLGATLSALGQHEPAVSTLRTAAEKAPEDPETLNYLGVALASLNRHQEARDAFLKALKVAPGFGDALLNLGEAHLVLGEHQATERLARSALQGASGHPRLLDLLARALAASGKPAAALEAARHAVAARPEDLQLRFNLAVTLQEAGEWAEAEALYKSLVKQKPSFAAAWANLGAILHKQDRVEEALPALRRALELEPQHLQARLNLANALEQASRLDEAEEQLRLGLRQAPDHPGLLILAAKLERRAGRPEAAVELLSRSLPTEISPVLRQDWLYEQGRNLDRVGLYREAFSAFTKANELAAKDAPALLEGQDLTRDMIARNSDCFSREWVASWRPLAPPRESPIFLVGFPRSGTTLLHHILAGHSRLQVLEEVEALDAARRFLEADGGSYPHLLADLTHEDAEAARQIYWEKARAVLKPEPGRRMVDKLPLNLLHIGLAHRLWPQAPIIFLVRHPYDVCLSAFMQHFDINDAMANFLSLEEAGDLYDRVMRLFTRYEESLPLPLLSLRYEDLLQDFEGEVGRLLEGLGLEWEEGVRNFAATARGRSRINTPSYSQVTEELYQRAVYRWENYQELLGPLQVRLGLWTQRFGYV